MTLHRLKSYSDCPFRTDGFTFWDSYWRYWQRTQREMYHLVNSLNYSLDLSVYGIKWLDISYNLTNIEDANVK